MATVQINTNYGDVKVADNMVFLPGNRLMPVEEYEELMMWEDCMRNRSTTKPSYHYLSEGEQTRIAIETMTAKLDQLIELLAAK